MPQLLIHLPAVFRSLIHLLSVLQSIIHFPSNVSVTHASLHQYLSSSSTSDSFPAHQPPLSSIPISYPPPQYCLIPLSISVCTCPSPSSIYSSTPGRLPPCYHCLRLSSVSSALSLSTIHVLAIVSFLHISSSALFPIPSLQHSPVRRPSPKGLFSPAGSCPLLARRKSC